MQVYNLIALFQFITEDLEMYFHHKLLSMAFEKPQNLHLATCRLGGNASFASMSSITMHEKNPYQLQVTNIEEKKTPPIFWTVLEESACTCRFLEKRV